jgi:imidazoleglycerol phosphate synthase glutamine amidotransferase subunit HisH
MLVIVDYHMGNLHSVKKKLDFLKVDSVISSDPAVILSASKLILPGVGHFGQAMENLRKLNLIDALNEAVLVKKTPILGICLGMQLMARESREARVRGERLELDARVRNERLELEARVRGEKLELEGRSEDAERGISGGVERSSRCAELVEVSGIERSSRRAELVEVSGVERSSRRAELVEVSGVEMGLGWFDAEVVKFSFEDTLRFKVPHTGWNTISIEKESPLMKDIPKNSEFYFVHSYYMKANNPSDVLNYTEYGSRFASAISKDNIYGCQYHPEKSHDVGLQLIRNFVLLS